MPTEPTLLEESIQIGSAAAGAGGGFFLLRWVFDRVVARLDRRQANLDAQDERVDREWQKIREKVEQRLDRVERQNEALRFAFHHVAGALIRIDPQNPALAQAEQMLAQAFPIDFALLGERAGAALDKAQGTPPAP